MNAFEQTLSDLRGERLDTETTIDVLRAAHAEELERVRREAYRQGVEDALEKLAKSLRDSGASATAALVVGFSKVRLEQLNKEARG